MIISLDVDACNGCKSCWEKHPAFFAQNGNAAMVIANPKNDEEKATCRAAKDDCPVNAIAVKE